MSEREFVKKAMEAAKEILQPPLFIASGKALLYQVTVNDNLEVTINPRKPMRGYSAFQTDLCVFEKISDEVSIPRVVIEFKLDLSTHDVITYSLKARKHKQVYPYLRYGLVIANETTIPGRFFTHNEALDFCVAAASYKGNRILVVLNSILRDEIAASRRLQEIAFGKVSVHVFRVDVILKGKGDLVM